MAGKICKGEADKSAAPIIIKESRAFCEGRAAQIAGTLIGDNPYTPQGAAMAKEASSWDRGHNDAAAANPKGCCAE